MNDMLLCELKMYLQFLLRMGCYIVKIAFVEASKETYNQTITLFVRVECDRVLIKTFSDLYKTANIDTTVEIVDVTAISEDDLQPQFEPKKECMIRKPVRMLDNYGKPTGYEEPKKEKIGVDEEHIYPDWYNNMT